MQCIPLGITVHRFVHGDLLYVIFNSSAKYNMYHKHDQLAGKRIGSPLQMQQNLMFAFNSNHTIITTSMTSQCSGDIGERHYRDSVT